VSAARAERATAYEDDLINRARELQRLATKRRKLRRQLKAVDVEIRHARKALNAIKQASAGRRPDVAPSRLHGGVTGFDHTAAKASAAAALDGDLSDLMESSAPRATGGGK
jgi:phage shock protein A